MQRIKGTYETKFDDPMDLSENNASDTLPAVVPRRQSNRLVENKMNDAENEVEPMKGSIVTSENVQQIQSSPNTLRKRPQLAALKTFSVTMDLSEILDFLYLGAKESSEDLQTLENHGISHIVNCTTDCKNLFADHGIVYFPVNVKDDINSDLYPYLEPAARFIEEARLNNCKSLVHCNMGMSRSSSIVLAYLMIYQGMNLAQAMRLAKERRTMVSPNSGFMKQLLDLELARFGKNTLDLALYKKERFAPVDDFILK